MQRLALSLCVVLWTATNPLWAQDARIWGSAEYLMWWISDGPAPPPLATTAPGSSGAFFPGALGNLDTSVALGGNDIDPGMQHGGRFTFGAWLTPDELFGVEANYLFLAKDVSSRSISSDGAYFLTNPFFDVSPGVMFPIANYLAVPGPDQSGAATMTTYHQMHSAEVNGLLALWTDQRSRWHLLGGYRYLNFEEGLSLSTVQIDNVLFFPGQFVNTFDAFDTRNNFHGGQLGLRHSCEHGIWFLESTVKVAFGNTRQVLRVRGESTTNTGPFFGSEIPVTTVPGGIYAQPTNIGEYERDRFAVLPEVSLQAGIYLTNNIKAFMGYNFLYLSDVARPGNQIDGAINSTQLVSFYGVPAGPLVGEPRPAANFHSSDFWAQGINFGLSLQW